MAYRTGNYTAFYVAEPFHPSSLGAHATKDFQYYNTLRMWKGADTSFPFVDSHDRTYSVRDGSDWESTLKPRLRERLRNSKNIILILGGADKGLDIDPLLEEIEKACKDIVLLKGTGSDRIFQKKASYLYDDLEMAVQAALGRANEGDVVLFSPAFASFGMFKNEYDRNDRFVKLIRDL